MAFRKELVQIMIADDSAAIRKALSEIVLKVNHEVIAECENSDETLEKFKSKNPEIVFLDWEMPKVDGLTMLKEMKKINPNAKIIMITAHENMSLIENCIKEGAIAYIIKPFDDEKIYDAISFAME